MKKGIESCIMKMKAKKGVAIMAESKSTFIKKLLDNVIASDELSKTYAVPSKREQLALKIDNRVTEKLLATNHLEKMVRTLIRRRSKSTQKEIVNITLKNYRIFL
ncbi:hypothetical protein [Ligilactobacillus agilis]|uniref:hypothetical protein n=1 Tax=Ligilactobacillus agilis TaxID=1601 RepID=UPI001EF47AAE|nr:hypothetical protein [Ligilactobacillus agilis]MDK6809552.1 hypothetical protein [Ligilactobacillus agilis]